MGLTFRSVPEKATLRLSSSLEFFSTGVLWALGDLSSQSFETMVVES